MSDDAEARAYQAANFGDVDQPYVEHLLALLRNRPRPRPRPRIKILDLGTGPADIPIRIARQLPNAHIIALDASAAMLALAKQKISPREGARPIISLIRSDAKLLPFHDSTFDAVISNSLLHHLSDPISFWKEIRRVTKPKAVVLVQDLFRPPSRITARALMHKHAAHESKLLQQLFYQSLLAAFTPAEVRHQLDKANLGLAISTIDDRHIVIEGKKSGYAFLAAETGDGISW